MNAKPERNKLRRKLQKVNHHHASTHSSRATTPDVKMVPPSLSQHTSPIPLQPTKFEPVISTTCEVNNPSREQHVHRNRAASDPRGGISRLHRLGPTRRPDHLANIAEAGSERSNSPLPIIPEFAHLSSNGSKRAAVIAKPGDATRLSGHKQAYSTSSIPDSPIQPVRERRYAKTPIRSIEQLENASARDAVTAQKVSSVDLIAESYRVLIEADRSLLRTPKPANALPLRRASQSTTEDVCETVVVAASESESEDDWFDPETPRAEHFVPITSGGGARRSPRPADSPLSDAGTLVGPEEIAAAIYFKPSFSPGSTPILHDFVQQTEPTSPSTTTFSMDRNPGLSICLDLLSRELLSAAAGSPMRPGSETSALQLQTMIEAYENLRDQATRLGLGTEQALATRDMFDTWIQALRLVQAKISIRNLPARAIERRRPAMAELE
ncbi:uncharacterized protein B0I36DRAFT_310438 [Microdochium trichocladiopsis]|uniref:Mating-type switching protein swi10 n=1 Tax=Microdochium trichocladiopsis TaxID=1682393 RepID=A0A9P8YJS4_9PEZI|nr:uncharacterized protein B0I36DRAFT_310438 [Microdochium trichocladiopsis]KAH7040314.1 hypothetical protein B0I36DRAFT_310438 [Microdochium trichocladiopsis]